MRASYEKRSVDFLYLCGESKKNPLYCSAHFHPHIEFFYLKKGKMNCQIDAQHYEVEAGDFLVAFPNQIHAFDEMESEEHELFIIHPDMMPELSSVFTTRQPKSAVIKHMDEKDELMSLFRQMVDVAYRPGGVP